MVTKNEAKEMYYWELFERIRAIVGEKKVAMDVMSEIVKDDGIKKEMNDAIQMVTAK